MQKTTKKKKIKTSPPAPVKKMKKIRHHRIKEILLGFAILVVLIMITPAILSLFFKDIQPVSAPDLALTKVSIPVSDNAYFDMLKVQNAAVEVPQLTGDQSFLNNVLAGTVWDQSAVDDAIAKNSEALKFFADAAKKPSYQFPAYADPANVDTASFDYAVGGQRNVSRTAVLNALNLQKQGKETEAFQQAMNMLHVGKIIQQSRTPLLGFLVGSNLKVLGMQTLNTLLANTKLPKEQLAVFGTQVQNVVTDTKSLANAFKMEHAVRMVLFDEDRILNDPIVRDTYNSYLRGVVLWRYWVPRSYYYQPNKIIKQWNEIDRAALAVATRPCSQTDQPVVPHSYSFTGYRLAFWLRLYFFPNAVGQFYNELGYVSTGSIWQKKCNADVLNSATQTLIALKEFSQDNGALPVALTQLVPTYLAAVPVDPYDGTPIKYNAEKKIIYSVGNDHVDSGGSTGDDWQKMNDPTFAVK